MKRIYLDHSATTPLDKEVLNEMLPYFTDNFGNGSSQHYFGREAMKGIDNARKQIAELINSKANEIYFTSGGTESDNWAVRGICEAYGVKGNHLITSCIEHPAMLKTFKDMEKKGFTVTYLNVDSDGLIDFEQLINAINKDTILISVMYANNEMGSIQDVKKIGELARSKGIIFHTDGVQAVGNIPVDVILDNIDLMSMSAHKFYGPKGVGAIYKRNGVKLGKFMTGGEQEKAMRPGTYNTPAIVGMGSASHLAKLNLENNTTHIKNLRDKFVQLVEEKIGDVYYNGTRDTAKRLPGNANFSFEFIEGESLLLRLDLLQIAVSSGSACSSGSLEPSYVLLAIGRDIALAHGSIRFSFGKNNTEEEVIYVVEQLAKSVKQLRDMSPLFKEIKGERFYV